MSDTSTAFKHTPTPWHVVAGTLIKDELMPFDRDERDTALIATADGDPTDVRAAANAAFIVRAVNSHEQLVAALRACLDADGISQRRAASALARAALAAAEA